MCSGFTSTYIVGRRTWPAWGILVSALAAAAFAYHWAALRHEPALPPVPEQSVDDFEPGVREQINDVLRKAKLNPTDASATGQLGMVLHAYQRYDAAARSYERARLLSPHVFKWLYLRGLVEGERGEHQRAIAFLTEALAERPYYAPAQIELADELLSAGRAPEARALYTAVIEEDPESAWAHYGLGRAYVATQDTKAAAEHFRVATELAPAFGKAHYALALAYRDLGDADRAEAHLGLYQRYKEVAPPRGDPLSASIQKLDRSARQTLRRAARLVAQNRIRAAVAQFELALQSDPRNLPAHTNLIKYYAEIGDFGNAERHFRAALEIYPQALMARLNHGSNLERQGRYDEALGVYEEASSINPYRNEARLFLGSLLERRGRTEEALAHYRKALEQDPHDVRANLLLGRQLLLRGERAAAEERFQAALVVPGSDRIEVLQSVGETYLEAGRAQRALEYFRRVRRRASKVGAWRQLAAVERQLCEIERGLAAR